MAWISFAVMLFKLENLQAGTRLVFTGAINHWVLIMAWISFAVMLFKVSNWKTSQLELDWYLLVRSITGTPLDCDLNLCFTCSSLKQ
jgi:hypothetical protein